jgi:hypothetical protein
MKRDIALTVSILLFFFSFAVHAADIHGNEGFGKAKWGMSKDEVGKALAEMSKKVDLLGDKGILAFGHVAGLPAKITCLFNENKFSDVLVTFEFGKDRTSAVAEFERLARLLTRKYGSPRSAPKDSYCVSWATDHTEIQLALEPVESGCQVTIDYACLSFHEKGKRVFVDKDAMADL